jgi:hypothetical protein
MDQFIPYILFSVLALVVVLAILYSNRKTGEKISSIRQRLDLLEAEKEGFVDRAYVTAELEKNQREASDKSSSELSFKLNGLRDELHSALNSAIEAAKGEVMESSMKHNRESIEQLAAKIDAVQQEVAKIPTQVTAPPLPGSPTQRPVSRPVSPQPAASMNDAEIKAKRLARLIVSDIALYNKKAVEEGVRTDKFFDVLAHDINEARSLYAKRVPESLRNSTNFLEEAFAELVAKTKRELGI